MTNPNKRSTTTGRGYSLFQRIPRTPNAPPGSSRFTHAKPLAKNAAKRLSGKPRKKRLRSRGLSDPIPDTHRHPRTKRTP